MSVSRGLVVVGTILSGALLTGPAALAQTCDAYSGTCPTPAPSVSPGPDQGEGGGPGDDGTTTGVGEGGGEGTLGGGGGTTVGDTGAGADDGQVADSGGATLPFTGGEIVLLSTLGLAAVGGGTVLVLAGRRRRDASPA